MRNLAGIVVVFVAGFVIMVLEIIGARYLARDFGSSFHVWVSQIGVVLIALAAGYYLGGWWADKWPRLRGMALLLALTGLLLLGLPAFAPWLLNRIIERHPPGQSIPLFWQKADPVLGSLLIFLWPCLVLAALSPFMIRRCSRELARVGRSSGAIIAAGTLGSIAGVFVSGFVLIDHMALSNVFRAMGATTLLLGTLCWWLDQPEPRAAAPAKEAAPHG